MAVFDPNGEIKQFGYTAGIQVHLSCISFCRGCVLWQVLAC